jgi:chloramphenicol-sensitive protein RarD
MSAPKDRSAATGVFFAGGAFVIWGLSPLYWHLIGDVPALQIATHRIVWSALLLLPVMLFTRLRSELLAASRSPRLLVLLTVTAILVASNWLTYIWAVTHGRLLQASLGYFINPLVNVLLGVVFLRERLRRAQAVAVLLATVGVCWRTVEAGVFPAVALILALTFGFYGLLRKRAGVSSVTGLAVETFLLAIPGVLFLGGLWAQGRGAFLHSGARTDMLLMLAGPFTAVPLVLFTAGARRIRLATVGIMQYVAPTLMFLLAVFVFRDPFSLGELGSFVLIWIGLAVYTADSIRGGAVTH